MAPSLIAQAGAQPVKQSRFASIHTSKALHGEVSNRFALQDPSAFVVERFYGGYQDCLLTGANVEIGPKNTWVGRPGSTAYTTFQFPTPPLGGFSYNENGVFTLYVDTATNIYTVTPTSGTSIYTKSAGAGQASYLQLGSTLFIADGVDAIKVIGGKVWNWAGAGPANAPTIVIVESGVAAVNWTASTVYTTMGLLVDGNGNVQELVSVNADGSNPNATIGTSGDGEPNFAGNQTPGDTVTEGSGTPITWTNKGPIVAWKASTVYNDATTGGTLANPCIIYDAASGSCYIGDTQGQQFTTGTQKPHFTGTFGQKLKDGTGYWVCLGNPKTPGLWQASTSYPAFGTVSFNDGVSTIVEPVTPANAGIGGDNPQQIFWWSSSGGTSGTGGTAPFPSGQAKGTLVSDNQLSWLNLGSATWAASTAYSAWSQGTNFLFSVIKDANSNLQVCITSGTSGAAVPGTSYALSAAANAAGGNTVYTGVFSPIPSATEIAVIAGFTTSANNGTFQVISATATTLTVNNPSGVAESHVATAVINPWGTTYGQNTTDGTVIWTCVGASLSWAASTKWFLPTSGFIPPQPTDPYGGSEVIDSNTNIEIAINNGKSGGSAPSWATGTGDQTTDGAGSLIWINNGPYSQASLSWTAGYAYGYSFKARTATDFYVTNIPNGLTTPNGPPTGAGDGTVSTSSPIYKMPTGPNAGAVVTVSGVGSLDVQFDTVVIWRCVDGFQGGPYLELTEIPMPLPVNGVAQPWSFKDTIPDVDLNSLITADVTGENDPPPVGLNYLAYHQGRVWGAVGNIVYASSGPDIAPDNGNGLTAWAPDNDFPLTSPVSKILAPITGLITFTTTDEWTIAGGPAITQYFPSVTRQGVGVLTQNAVASLGAEIIVFTADRRLLSFIPGAGETNIGWSVQDQFQSYDPSKVYVTLHENGIDYGVFVGNGSTTYKRVVLHSQPNNDIVWSPTATITGGCGMLQSLETGPGVRSLLIGGTSNNEVLLYRDISSNTDNGTTYDQNFVISPGPICHDGEMCELGFVTFTGARTGESPTVSYLLDELSGTYSQFASYVSDPPLLYGQTGQPATLYRNRYYFKQTMSDGNPPSNGLWCTDILLKVDWPAENAAHEIARFTLFGGRYTDPND